MPVLCEAAPRRHRQYALRRMYWVSNSHRKSFGLT
jgi:hypothetical protein